MGSTSRSYVNDYNCKEKRQGKMKRPERVFYLHLRRERSKNSCATAMGYNATCVKGCGARHK